MSKLLKCKYKFFYYGVRLRQIFKVFYLIKVLKRLQNFSSVFLSRTPFNGFFEFDSRIERNQQIEWRNKKSPTPSTLNS